jgi:hypothetical protein
MRHPARPEKTECGDAGRPWTMARVLQVCCIAILVLLAFCWSGSRKVATALGTWLGDRPLRRLFRYHSYVLPRLASAAPGWGSARDLRETAGGVACVYAGSLVLLPGGVLQRSGSGGGGYAC